MKSKFSSPITRNCVAYKLDCADISRRVNEVEHSSGIKIKINGNFALH